MIVEMCIPVVFLFPVYSATGRIFQYFGQPYDSSSGYEATLKNNPFLLYVKDMKNVPVCLIKYNNSTHRSLMVGFPSNVQDIG